MIFNLMKNKTTHFDEFKFKKEINYLYAYSYWLEAIEFLDHEK